MKILLINPPHPAIGSRIPQEHLPPLGLLAIGGPLIDAGHEVWLIDAEFGPLTPEEIAAEARAYGPEAVLLGHSGSTSGHPSAARVARAVRQALPRSWVIYGGVFPTYHGPEVLAGEPAFDLVVRGEGEETVTRLMAALASGMPLEEVRGIVLRAGTPSGRERLGGAWETAEAAATPPAPLIEDLDAWRVGWELIDHRRYSYWGGRRAVVVQFSRGCPHACAYCGQRGFWRTWRHRDPARFAAELARLHREQGVEVINFADENPTASREAWRAFLEALVRENVPLLLVGSTRAGDIVRDADLLGLYRRAGVIRFLLGIESTDEATLQAIRKGSTAAIDREAIRLLRAHGIISMAAWAGGFTEEGDADYLRTLRQLLAYDPDQVQAVYATPHRWTAFGAQAASRRIIQPDLSRWDYKHQVLESAAVPPWRVLLWVKFIEAMVQLRPQVLWRSWTHPDPEFRAGMRWYYRMGRRVWRHEVWHWIFRDRRVRRGPTLAEFWGAIERGEAGRAGSP